MCIYIHTYTQPMFRYAIYKDECNLSVLDQIFLNLTPTRLYLHEDYLVTLI